MKMERKKKKKPLEAMNGIALDMATLVKGAGMALPLLQVIFSVLLINDLIIIYHLFICFLR